MPRDGALAAVFRTDLDASVDDERMALTVFAVEPVQPPEVTDMVDMHGVTPAGAALSARIRHEVERGRLCSEEDPDALADIPMDMIFGAFACHRARRCGESDTAAARRTRVLRCIRVFLGGIGAVDVRATPPPRSRASLTASSSNSRSKRLRTVLCLQFRYDT